MLTYLNVGRIIAAFFVGFLVGAALQGSTMKHEVVNLTNDNFDKAVAANDVILIDFWAPWCGPCNQLTPTIEKLSVEYKNRVLVAKVNIDEELELAKRFKIATIPHMIIYKKGESKVMMQGIHSKANIKKKLDEILESLNE